jgi:serine/threonine protein kinase
MSSYGEGCDYLEDIRTFTVDAEYWKSMTGGKGETIPKFFVAIEVPQLTLVDVVHGLLENASCQTDDRLRLRYTAKVFSVLRLIAKGLRHIHSLGLVHGNISLINCAKYSDQKWKVRRFLGCHEVDRPISLSKSSISFLRSMPPEGFDIGGKKSKASIRSKISSSNNGVLLDKIVASTGIDSWAFGKLAYEVLTGEAFLKSDLLFPEEDTDVAFSQSTIDELTEELDSWSMMNRSASESHARKLLEMAKVPKSGITLILQCLSSDPSNRPQMDDIVRHQLWSDLRKLQP